MRRSGLFLLFLLVFNATLAGASVITPLATRAGDLHFPSGVIPFARIDYITDVNANGDRLVVGEAMIVDSLDPRSSWFQGFMNLVPVPDASAPAGQQLFNDRNIELAPGRSFGDVYVPTVEERLAIFSAFAGLLIDPLTGDPFPGGIIPVNRIGSPAALRICDNCAVEDVVPEPNTFGILGLALSTLGVLYARGRKRRRDIARST